MKSKYKREISQIHSFIDSAYGTIESLAVDEKGYLYSSKLETCLEDMEKAVLHLRNLYERFHSADGALPRQAKFPTMAISGKVTVSEYGWVQIKINTLLPHCRFRTPTYLSDTLTRLLDEYERKFYALPKFNQALLVIDEHCNIENRKVYDQDNKGWKAVPNAIKGRLIPDDDQFSLSIALLATRSSEVACYMTLLPLHDASDFFALRTGEYGSMDLYGR